MIYCDKRGFTKDYTLFDVLGVLLDIRIINRGKQSEGWLLNSFKDLRNMIYFTLRGTLHSINN